VRHNANTISIPRNNLFELNGGSMKTEQDLLKAVVNIRAELVTKLFLLRENPDPMFPKCFIDGMECAFLEAIIVCDNNTKQFFDEEK
jgi:hypothetical protein